MSFWDDLKQFGISIEDGIKTVYSDVRSAVSEGYDDLKGIAPGLWDDLKNIGGGLEKDIKDSYDNTVNQTGKTVSNLGQDAQQAVSSLTLPIAIAGAVVIIFLLQK